MSIGRNSTPNDGATGLVVVGDLVDAGGSLIGEMPKSGGMWGIAEPNMLVIAEGTRKLLGNLFELQDLGAKELKGIAGSVRVWAALRASSVESRFEALHASGLLPSSAGKKNALRPR
jgi:class 3 adenylate cyclase